MTIEADTSPKATALAAELGVAIAPASAVLTALPAHVAVLDTDGRVVLVNKAWRDFAAKHGSSGDGTLEPGANYLDICRNAANQEASARAALEGVSGVLSGALAQFSLVYACEAGGRGFWYRMDVAPIVLHERVGAVVSHLDVTAEKEAEQGLFASERNLRAIFDNAAVGIAELDPGGGWMRVNERFAHILDLTPAALMRVPLAELTHADDRDAYRALVETMRAGDVDCMRVEQRLARGDQAHVWINLTISCVRLEDGGVNYFVVIAEDISERQQAEERQLNLMRELAHRNKNLLAVVDSIANRSLRGGVSLDEAREAFTGRLNALASTYDALIHESFDGALLDSLLRNELEGFGGRVRFSGPRLLLTVKAAQIFGLVAHELATNAVKYGALSSPEGRIEIAWRTFGDDDNPRLAFEWRETGGPRVSDPVRKGYGSDLLSRIASLEFGCAPEIAYDEAGLRYGFEAQLARLGALAPETQLRSRLRSELVRAVYDHWTMLKGRAGSLPRLGEIDWPKFAASGSLTIARVRGDGQVQFIEAGRALVELLGDERADMAHRFGKSPDESLEPYRRCARERAPCHEFLKVDFGGGELTTFERLLSPFRAGQDMRTIYVVGVVVMEGVGPVTTLSVSPEPLGTP